VTRHVSIEWPDARPFRNRGGAPIRLLAISDQFNPVLADERSRRAVGPIDLVIGCGDLDCDDLSFLADGFNAPLVYVLGNHDAGLRWDSSGAYCPAAIPSARVHREAGLSMVGLSWPGVRGPNAHHDERGAWNQAVSLAMRRLRRSEPLIVFSHVPPRGAGDVPGLGFHRGFHGYWWLLHHLHPPLWLHGHTPLAATTEWHIEHGPTTLVNVTGAVVIEIWPPGSWAASMSQPAGAADRLPDGSADSTDGRG
jgi:uncharacterized protein